MAKKRYIFFWLSFLVSYAVPIIYFATKYGLTKQKVAILLPILVLALFGVIKLGISFKSFVDTWRPSIFKGLLLATPKILLFIILITFGVVLQDLLKKQINVSLYLYFETVITMLGSNCVGSILEAFHLKYKELDLISKGYVLGVVNKR